MEKEEQVILSVLLIVLLVSVLGVVMVFSQDSVSGFAIKLSRVSSTVANPGGASVSARRFGEEPMPEQFMQERGKRIAEGAENERLIGRYYHRTLR